MKRKFKSLIFGMLSLLIVLTNITPINVNAATYTTSSKKHEDWWLAEPSAGRRDSKEGELRVNGERAFCIDAFVKFKSGVTMKTVDWKTVGISESLAEELSLIAYFGTQVSGRTSDDWYAITQGLIWKVRHEADGHTDMCYVETPTNPNYSTTVKLWNQILNDVKEYKKKPSFTNGSYNLNVGESLTLTDTNSSLKNMIVKDNGGLDVSISGNNKLIIKANANSKENATITLQRNIKTSEVGTSLVFYNGKDQSLAQFKIKKPLEIKLNVKVNKFGSLELTKTNAKTNDPIPNTEFRITGPNDYNQTYKTDSNGKIKIDNLPLGDYVAVETKAAHGYLINVTKFGFTITPNETTQLNVTNVEPKGKITLTKYNEDKSATIPNTKYHVTSANGYDEIHTTDKNGKLVLENLKLSTYTFVEIQSADGYLLNSEPITVKLTYKDQNTEIITGTAEQTNKEPKAQVTIQKEDRETGKVPQGDATLQGAEYQLLAKEDIYNKSKTKKYYSKGDIVATRITDEKGNMKVIDNLPLDQYQLIETKASEGYLIDETKYDITCSYEGQKVNLVLRSQVSKEQVMKQAFEIVKISSDGTTGEVDTLANAEFTVKLKSETDQVGWDKAKTYDVLKTDKKGYAKSIELPYGEYVVKETKTPDEHYKVDDFKVVINKDSREPQTWRVLNDGPFKALIKAVKLDKETGKTVLLPNTTFKIKNLDTNEYVGHWVWFPIPHYVDEFTTDESGTVTTPETLDVGQYQLEEIKAPYGYLINDKPIKFKITSNTAYEIAPDEKTPIIIVTKEDTSVKGQISVTKIGEQLTDIKTDKKGNIQFVYNKLPVDGAQFIIEANEDIYSADNQKDLIYSKGYVVEELTTKDGLAKTSKLPLGKYRIYEKTAGNSFVINKEIKEIELTYEDQFTPVVFEETEHENQRQKVDLTVKKLDKEDKTLLAGAEFGLYAREDIFGIDKAPSSSKLLVKAGTLIETVTTDETGTVKFKADLPINGHFEIKELNPPIGYSSTDEIIEINTKYQGQEKETIYFEPLFKNEITKVEVSKKDITNDEEIEGAFMCVYPKDNQGEMFDSWISGQDGKNEDGTIKPHMIKGLEVGQTYVLKEISSPHGYALAQDIEFTVEDTGIIQQVEMKDEMVLGHLKWSKSGEIFNETILGQTEFGQTESPVWNKSNLLGATIGIYAAEDITIGNHTIYTADEKIETLESDWEATMSKELPVGMYYYLEETVPHGYIKDTNKHYFEIKDSQSTEIQISESTLENQRPTVDINMTKVLEEQEIFKNPNAYKDIVFGIFAREDIFDYMGNIAIEHGTMIYTSGINEDGHLTLAETFDFPNGVYYLKELSTNGQYVLNDKEHDFEIAYHGEDVSSYTVRIGEDGQINNDLARGTIQVKKVDTNDKDKILTGVEFNISTKEDMSEIIKTVKTDAKGIATFDDLELGIYYIQEAKQIDSYVLNDHIYKVEVTKDGDILTIICENKPTEMIFSKQDFTTGQELEGAHLIVKDKETGKVVDEWVSEKEPHIIKYLVEGKEYIMIEKIAPNGYEVAECITFVAKDGEKIVMKDKLKPSSPKTGDTTNLTMWLALTLVSGIGLTAMAMKKKKEQQENE